LFALTEKGLLETSEVIECSGKGSLWVSYQYIEKGLLDLVEADLKRDVTSRDFYGPLFENTQLVLARLLEVQENERVLSLYKSAIAHRLKAMKEESAIVRKFEKGSNAHGASKKWLKHYSPALKRIIKDYGALLKGSNKSDPELENIRKAIRACDP
jgi:hypothetical protein